MTPKTAERQHIVRERDFIPSQLDEVMFVLRETRATGTLTVSFNQGGVGTVRFVETQRVQISLDTRLAADAESHS